MNEQPVQFVPDFRFSDRTILEADGEYDIACVLMKDEPFPWCLRTDLTLVHPFGMCDMALELFSDRSLKIVKFKPSVPDALLNFDVRSLTQWASKNGWNTPVPSKHVIDSAVPFWKHQWETHAVNSPDLDSRYGLRSDMNFPEGQYRRDDEAEQG